MRSEVENDWTGGGIVWSTFLTDIIGSWTVTVEVVQFGHQLLIDAIRISDDILGYQRVLRGYAGSHVCYNLPLSSGCVTWAFLYRKPIGRINLSYLTGRRVKSGPTTRPVSVSLRLLCYRRRTKRRLGYHALPVDSKSAVFS